MRRLRRGGWKRNEVEEAKEVLEVKDEERSRTRQRFARRRQRRKRRKSVAAIPRLRGPTRQNAARKKKSGRSARDDRFWEGRGKGARAGKRLLQKQEEEKLRR